MNSHTWRLSLIVATSVMPELCHAQQVEIPKKLRDLSAVLVAKADVAALRSSKESGLMLLAGWMDDKTDPFPSEIVLLRRSDMSSKPLNRLTTKTTWIELKLQKRFSITIVPRENLDVQLRSLTNENAVAMSLDLAKKASPPERLTTAEAAIKAFESVEQMKQTQVLASVEKVSSLDLDAYLNLEGGIQSVECTKPKEIEDEEGGLIFECVVQSPAFHVDLSWSGSKWIITGAGLDSK